MADDWQAANGCRARGGIGDGCSEHGGAWNISDSYSLRVEYQRFLDLGDEDTGAGDVDLIGLSVLFR